MRKLLLFLVLTAALSLAIAACGDDDDDDGGATETDAASEGVDVAVSLREFSVLPDPDSAPAGTINFNVENVGPDDPHEFVVIKTDLAATDLPTGDDGAVLEDGEGIELIDEVEELEVGDTATLSVDLEPGKYVLICNLVEEEDDGLESHYQEGMRRDFTVE